VDTQVEDIQEIIVTIICLFYLM